MADNVIELKQPKDPITVKLVELGGDLDQVVIHYLNQGLDPKEVAAVYGQRLSELLTYIGDNSKHDMRLTWGLIQQIVNKRVD